MSETSTRRLLIVANRTESTPRLLEEVQRRARGHRHSLPKRIQDLGIPVSAIPPDASGWSYSHGFPDEWVRIEVGPLT
jgi:hypothetical protein